jgi:hypothetical protein
LNYTTGSIHLHKATRSFWSSGRCNERLHRYPLPRQTLKAQLAERLQTGRSLSDRLLDSDNTAITLESLERLASAVGRQLRIDLAWRFAGNKGWLPHGSSPRIDLSPRFRRADPAMHRILETAGDAAVGQPFHSHAIPVV